MRLGDPTRGVFVRAVLGGVIELVVPRVGFGRCGLAVSAATCLGC